MACWTGASLAECNENTLALCVYLYICSSFVVTAAFTKIFPNLSFGLVFVLLLEHESTVVLTLLSVHVRMRVFVFRSIYKPASSVAFVPSVGRELPSHYSGSTTSRRLCVSVSPNLPLFSLHSLVISLFHSLRQLPSPSGSQSIPISFSFAPDLLCSPVNPFLFLTVTL